MSRYCRSRFLTEKEIAKLIEDDVRQDPVRVEAYIEAVATVSGSGWESPYEVGMNLLTLAYGIPYAHSEPGYPNAIGVSYPFNQLLRELRVDRFSWPSEPLPGRPPINYVIVSELGELLQKSMHTTEYGIGRSLADRIMGIGLAVRDGVRRRRWKKQRAAQ